MRRRKTAFFVAFDPKHCARVFRHCGVQGDTFHTGKVSKTAHSCVGIFEIPTRAVVALFLSLNTVERKFLFFSH